jgi:hypothetical protein
MDLRLLFPADTRYGPMVFSTWDRELVACGNALYKLADCELSHDGNSVRIRWWKWTAVEGRYSALRFVYRITDRQMMSEIACILSDLAQATSVDLDIESDPQDPLV